MSSSRKIIRSASNKELSNYLGSFDEEKPVTEETPEDFFQEEEPGQEEDYLALPEKKEEDPYHETLLHLALEKAQRIIDTAEKEAQRIKEDAKEDGYKEGFREGYEKGKEEAEERILSEHAEELDDFRQELNRTLRTVEDAKTERLYRYMDELKDVAKAVAEKVIYVSLRSSGEVIRRMILTAVASELSQVSDNIKFVIVENEEPGTLILETQEEIVDAGIGTQMENLRERLGHLDTQESV